MYFAFRRPGVETSVSQLPVTASTIFFSMLTATRLGGSPTGTAPSRHIVGAKTLAS